MTKINMHGQEWELIDCTSSKDKKLVEEKKAEVLDKNSSYALGLAIRFKIDVLKDYIKRDFAQFKDEAEFNLFIKGCIDFQHELWVLYTAETLDKMVEACILKQKELDVIVNLINLDFEIFYFAEKDFNNLRSILKDYLKPIYGEIK